MIRHVSCLPWQVDIQGRNSVLEEEEEESRTTSLDRTRHASTALNSRPCSETAVVTSVSTVGGQLETVCHLMDICAGTGIQPFSTSSFGSGGDLLWLLIPDRIQCESTPPTSKPIMKSGASDCPDHVTAQTHVSIHIDVDVSTYRRRTAAATCGARILTSPSTPDPPLSFFPLSSSSFTSSFHVDPVLEPAGLIQVRSERVLTN